MMRRLAKALVMALGLALVCETARAAGPGGPSKVPSVDTSIHSVPLKEVVFDTFNGGYIRLSESPPEVIERLRDAIRPIYKPRYEGPEGGVWLRAEDLVIGYAGEKEAYAYPIKILNFHEIVNDVIDGRHVLVSYCPLCGSGIVFDRRLDGQVLLFGNTSALFENDMVMYDHQSGSYWFQARGEAIVGPLTGKQLKLLPSMTTPWGVWRGLHPNTRVLSPDRGYPYDRDPFASYGQAVDKLRFPFPVSEEKLDGRLRPSSVVLSVQVKGVEKAYPLERLGDSVVNDTVGTEPVAVFAESRGPSGSAFLRRMDGRTLTFAVRNHQITDQQTGSQWDLLGRAVRGPLRGRRLKPLPTRRAFWFSLSIAVPGISFFLP